MMATVHSSEQKNNLELYLNDVYEKECVFKIEQEEVEFIQTGIETLVQDLVDKILAHDSFDKLVSDGIDESFLTEEMYIEKCLAEVYFPIQSDCSLQRYVAENASCVKSVKSTIIKVGSFYDGTRNNFPDEFDFIFLLLGFRTLPFQQYRFSTLHYHVQETINMYGKSFHYPLQSENHQVTRKLDFEKVIDIHGPACKIQFIYSNGFGEQRPIHVDLVPAAKIIDINTQQQFEEIKSAVEPETFRAQILSAGSCLYVDGYAYTEIEQHFMKNIISKKHVKVYRILKYLMNGHGDAEECEERVNVICFSSYRIKILMIYHHEACTNTNTEGLGPCVLQVLQKLSYYEKKPSELPNFNGRLKYDVRSPLLPYLKSTSETLKSMQTSKKSYNYERDKIMSVSRQCLESLTGDSDENLSIRTGYLDRNTRPCCVIL